MRHCIDRQSPAKLLLVRHNRLVLRHSTSSEIPPDLLVQTQNSLAPLIFALPRSDEAVHWYWAFAVDNLNLSADGRTQKNVHRGVMEGRYATEVTVPEQARTLKVGTRWT